ncbi:DUF1284 domain-containing protein [Rhizobium oryzicola]|uniref:DUF1284 domain-containing protein n=1 Tax=Rhizobium oryzicola TaxID=1232668 RepID=A0ABT8SSX1_9HYPH|nr:DUF1284 domain-containing protein [Rhizobium oryzicola]MDO1581345.1 DUF1284 domain-containing protein [Rhizobium oryzicola]
MTIRLRAHHLLCMLTFVGEGYSPDFTRNYREIAGRITAGEAIEIVDGPDDICAPLIKSDASAHCFNERVVMRDREAAAAVSSLLQRPIEAGVRITLTPALMQTLRRAFADRSLRTACHGCEWAGLCDRVSDACFPGVLILPEAV